MERLYGILKSIIEEGINKKEFLIDSLNTFQNIFYSFLTGQTQRYKNHKREMYNILHLELKLTVSGSEL